MFPRHTRLVYDTQGYAWGGFCLPCAVRYLQERLIREVERRRTAEAELPEVPTVPPLSPLEEVPTVPPLSPH